MATWSSYHGYPVYQGNVISDVATSLVTGFDKREDARKKAEAEAAKAQLEAEKAQRTQIFQSGLERAKAGGGWVTGDEAGNYAPGVAGTLNDINLQSAIDNQQKRHKAELDARGVELDNKKKVSDNFDSGWKKANEALQGLAKTEKLLAVNDAITGGSQSAEFQQSMAQSIEYIAKETGVPKSVLTALQTGQKAEDVYTAYKLNEITQWDEEIQKSAELKDYKGIVKSLAKKQDTIVKLAINGKMDPTLVKKMYDDAESFKKETLKTMMTPKETKVGETGETLAAKMARGEQLTPAEKQTFDRLKPPKEPVDRSTESQRNLAQINRERIAAGQKPMTLEQYRTMGQAQSPTDVRREAADIAKMESTILANKDRDDVGPQVDAWRQMAKKPYTYTWKPGIIGGSWEKLKLPVLKGKQVTSDEVYFTAEKNGMTYDDVLKQIGAIK